MNLDISYQSAQDIVTEMKEIIHQDINYINTEGVIIASTVQNRIGSFHGGGKRVIRSKNDLIIHYDGEYVGTLKGINLPIYYEHKIIGVIGITGDKEEVEKYGKIIQKMTELMIKDAYLTNLKNKNIENQRLVIEEILVFDEHRNDSLLDHLKLYNVKENIPRIVIVSKIVGEEYSILDKKEQIWNIFEYSVLSNSGSLMMWKRNNITAILENVSYSEITELLMGITKKLYEKLNLQVFFGVGTIEEKIKDVKVSYKNACLALNISKGYKNNNVIFYDELDIELIIENIEENIATDFCDKVLGNLSTKEKEEFAEIIKIFEKYNGSINQTSLELFIHKNTLQYKLNKLKEKTAYDMRNYQDYVALKIAFLLNSFFGK